VKINIASLSMELPYRDEARGRVLALAVIRALEELPPLPVAGKSLSISNLRVDVPRFPPGTDEGHIVRTVATAIHRSMARSLGVAGPKAIGPAEAVRLGLSAPAHPLDAETRAALESELGRDLAQVRVHEGPQARTAAADLQASAFTVGRDVVLGAGVRASKGDKTLRHEVAHAVQQGLVDAGASTSLRLTDPIGPEERDAHHAAETGARPSISSAAAVARDLLTYSSTHTDVVSPIGQTTAVLSVSSAPTAASVEAALAPLIAAGKIAKHVSGDRVSFSAQGATLAQVEAALLAAKLPSAHDMAVGLLDPHNMVFFTGERVTKMHSLVTIPVSTEKDVVEPAIPRPLTAFERGEIDKVFKGHVDLDKVSLSEDPVMSVGGYARTLPGTIYFPTGTFGRPSFTALLIHEMTHIWQYTRGVSVVTTAYHAIFSTYDYGGAAGLVAAASAGKHFKDFNTEQQGDILRDYYRALVSGMPTTPWDPFVTQMLAM